MGMLISLQKFRDSHEESYLRGLVFEAWSHWLNGVNPVRETVESSRYGWNKEESDETVRSARKADNEKVMKAYKIK